jgi:hypothetical protein
MKLISIGLASDLTVKRIKLCFSSLDCAQQSLVTQFGDQSSPSRIIEFGIFNTFDKVGARLFKPAVGDRCMMP